MATKADFTSKPPLGGWLPSITLTQLQLQILDAIADEIIPPGEGFPAPSSVGVAAFIAKYVAPDGQPSKWFPYFGEVEFKGRLDRFGSDFLALSTTDRVLHLQSIEQHEADYFGRMRDMVYFAYYSTAEVIKAINVNLEAGKDYRLTPQPYGYAVGLEDWDPELIKRARGSYTRTEDVVRVNLEGLLS